MDYAAITYSKGNHIALLTLNRPQANNVINQQMAQEMAEACQRINQDDEVYVVIITGAGDSAFCQGSDEPQMTGYNPAAAIASIDRPVIAAINGDALGQGLELAVACDIRLASNRAVFGLPGIEKGLVPTDGGTQRLPRIVGKAKALELVLTAQTIDAEEALEIGLVNKIVAPEELGAHARAMAQTIAAKGPIAIRYTKEAVDKGLDLTLEQGLRLEADLYALLQTTADRTEGITAFREKRPPRFNGR